MAKTDDLGRVRVLFLGATALRTVMLADPTLDVYPVPAYLFGMGDTDVRRSLRIYMPRTYSELAGEHDVIHICDSAASSYTSRWLSWMADAVSVDGLGFVMSGGAESFGGHLTLPPWCDTFVGGALAVDCLSTLPHLQVIDRFFKMIVTEPDDPLMASLPFETAPGFHYVNREVSPKEGSSTLAVADLADRYPLAVLIEVGRGRSLSFMGYIANPTASIVPFAGWEFFTDFICNLMIYPAQAPLPADYLKTHTLRMRLSHYSELRKTVIDILSFADKFGANTEQADAQIASADRDISEARMLFIRKEMDESGEVMDRASESLEQARAIAMEAKDRALVWVYAIEWLAITGTSLICGFVIWSLMVRRRLYREVGATRLASKEEA